MARERQEQPAPDRATIARVMRDLDLCMMATISAEDGRITARPMSNNRQVDWDGDSWFFCDGDSRKVADLKDDPTVALTFQAEGLWLTIEGEATLHQDERELFAAHWTPDLERWFEAGIDTPGLTLIEVTGLRAEIQGRHGEGTVELED